MTLFIFLILALLLPVFSISVSKQLSTFKTESLNISQPPYTGNIIDEALWLLKEHFYKSHLYTEEFWNELKLKSLSCRNPHEVDQ